MLHSICFYERSSTTHKYECGGADDDFPLSQLSAQHSGSSSVLGLLTYDEKMRVVAIIDITYVILSF